MARASVKGIGVRTRIRVYELFLRLGLVFLDLELMPRRSTA